MANQATTLVFSPLSSQAREELTAARTFISETISDLFGNQTLTHSERDLPILQALASHRAMENANFEAWVALGITFGDALITLVPGLRWKHVTDQFGDHVALQFEEQSLSIAAPTMLWKRVERGESIDLDHIASELQAFVIGHAHEYGNA